MKTSSASPIKLILLGLLTLSMANCSGTNLGDQVSLASGGTPVTPPSDTTPPILQGSIVDATDSATDRAATALWAVATDNDEVDHYKISVAEDDLSGTCDNSDFANPVGANIVVPANADFSGTGFQLVDGQMDGDNGAIALNLKGSTSYCTRVVAVDASENESDPIFSASPWNFLYESCLEAKTNEPSLTDGVYSIDPDGVAGVASYDVFCDMTTQGGGWTLVIRYDTAEANASNFFLPTGTGQIFTNLSDLQSLNATGNLTASADMVPFIQNGATHLMHVGKADDAASDSSTYLHLYFSEIYQSVLTTPTNIFNNTLDTNSGDGVSGAIVNGMSAVRKDQWFEADFSVMTAWDTDGSTANSYRIDGGEGSAMFTNGDREGAVYCTGVNNSATGHSNPKVQWGFAGKDGTGQSYGGTIHVGTNCKSDLSCGPANQINLMFIR